MKRSHWITALTSALVTLLVAPVAAADSPGHVDICHASNGASVWNLQTVSTRSLDQHMGHGDGMPLGEVPGSEGSLYFDESCDVVPGDPDDPGDPGSETVFAIAYTDVDQDGSYDSAGDVLIAKFVDGPAPADDGLPGAGDLIVTDQYPLDVGMSAFGVFGVTEHVVTGSTFTGTRCMAAASSGSFIWEKSTTLENYEESAGSGNLSFFRDSTANGGSDVLVTAAGSPSEPTTPVSVGAFDGADGPFVEVELACSG